MKPYEAMKGLRQTYFGTDLSQKSDLELLTLLLSYTEVDDPAPLAKKLLSEKGSLQNILLLEEKQLLQLGVGANSACMLTMLLPAYSRALVSDFAEGMTFDSTAKLGEYFARRFCGISTEMVYLLLLNKDFTAIGCHRVSWGSINTANLNIRTLVEMALFKGATYVAISHNHPGGSPQPSQADRSTTLNLQAALSSVGIGLLDHIIVAGDRYVPILLNSHGLFRE